MKPPPSVASVSVKNTACGGPRINLVALGGDVGDARGCRQPKSFRPELVRCGKPATWTCSTCGDQLCDDCAHKHGHFSKRRVE